MIFRTKCSIRWRDDGWRQVTGRAVLPAIVDLPADRKHLPFLRVTRSLAIAVDGFAKRANTGPFVHPLQSATAA